MRAQRMPVAHARRTAATRCATDPVARVDQSCVGCGLCGEVAHAAVLCPSFYEARVVHNARAWERARSAAVRARVIGWLQAA